jgi:ABC-type glycerol-3-phosphate transport system substrate-binding protein
MRHRLRPARAVAAVALAAAAAVSCAAPPSAGARLAGLRGQRLQVAAVWSGAEQRHFGLVLRAFARQTGVRVSYLSAGYSVPDFLAARLAAGRPPDVAFLPQPGLLCRYASEHRLVPLDQTAGAAVADNYDPAWRRLGSCGGRLYGVWFKAANKSLIWYNVDLLERAGIVPPASLADLVPVERKLAEAGIPAFAVGGADGWTLADWFSNLYLRIAGPGRYDRLAAHQIRWTDPSVRATLRLLAQVLAPGLIAGGPRGALNTSYQESVQETFAQHPAAAMVFEGDFVAGVISAATRATLGVDADVAPFPSAGRAGPVVVAGGDAAVLMRRSAASAAFIRYLASPQAAAIWARQGGFVSPNISLGLSAYPGAVDRSIASALLQAGPNFRFSLSDLVPASFGGTEGRGMRAILQRFLLHRDVAGTADALEQAAREAYRR